MKGTSPLPYFLLSLRAVGLHTALLLLTCCCLRQPTARADEPVIHLSFSSEQTLPMQARGNVLRDQAGPRPPAFPDFNGDNTAVRLDGKSYLAFKDPVDHDRFDFRNGDEITLEAWVKLEDARDGQQTYVIGKGRTGNAGMAKDNQNWALRTVSQKGIVRLSFLFASKKSGNQSHWHRWTSTLGFTAKSGWHHIAVTYRFGNPKSIGGWIDGVPTDGAWDMGGATTLPPVVDEDDVWVGSASGGNPGNSFRGWLDEVAVHREILDDKELRSRFKSLTGPRIAGPLPEEMPNVGPIPAGRVLMSFAEGMPDERRWLIVGESWPAETTRLLSDQFLLNRIPIRYDDWGIRSAWKPPVLARCAADVVLPVGTHEFVVRTRSLARLWIDGKLVARIKPARRRSGNLEPVEEPPEPLSIGGRRLAFTQQETIGSHFVQESKTSRVVLEFLVGSKKERTDPGESLVAIRIGGEQQYRVLSPNLSLSLTDRSVTAALKKIDRQMTTLDDSNRRQAAASQDGYWRERHDVARGKGTSSNASIEDYIDSKLTRAKKRAAQFDSDTTEHFHETVLPLLREQCFRCHGDKAQGGLRLTRRESALLSGDSGIAAVVPGKPAES
ncbi:MAG: LamG-like jellyroll fold domain-containing protein, partial [Planctomycetaceae bacterium]